MVIKFTPRDGSTERTLTLTEMFPELALRGFVVTEGGIRTSPGRVVVAAHTGSHFEYKLRCDGMDRTVNPTGDTYTWELLQAFLSHITAGGSFKFFRDVGNDLDTTLATLENAGTAGSSDLDMTSSTNLSVGDHLYLEHLTDKTRWEIVRCTALSTENTVVPGVTIDYPAGSIVRHWEYFPVCYMAKPFQLTERRAGKGVDKFDLRLQFVVGR